jgi:hypothetical protein
LAPVLALLLALVLALAQVPALRPVLGARAAAARVLPYRLGRARCHLCDHQDHA